MRYLRLALLMIGWLVVLEIILRLPPVKARLERYAHQPVWYSPYVPQRMALIRKNQDADIWYVGSSAVVLGINPEAIDPLMNGETSEQHKSLNLGLLGMFFIDHIEDYLVNDFLPLGKPKIVALCAFPSMFAFDTKAFHENPVEYEQTRDHYGEWDRKLSLWLYDHLALFRFINTFRYVISESPADQADDTPTGFIPVYSGVSIPDVPKWSPNINDRLELSLSQVKHLRDTLQERDIQLVFIKLPFFDPLKDRYPGGKEAYQAFTNRLSSFMDEERIPYLDAWEALENSSPDNQLAAAEFMDFYHLNDAGTKAIAPFIAHFLATVLEPASSTAP
jgi:hypothetical protein